ncbi:hypothetical protein WG936_08165 [Corynebacterium sp. H127]|uniref:phage portal protein family protein n=1 Tax=Corynebacterium sp. H127 TaxID=3133418 RepID=UPI00309F370A
MAETPPPSIAEKGYVNGEESDFYAGWKDIREVVPDLQFPESFATFDRMRKSDAQVATVIKAITLPIRGTTWRIDPNGARDEVVEFVAEQLNLPIIGKEGTAKTSRRLHRFTWSEHLRMALLCIPFGCMFFEQIVEQLPDGKWGYRKIAERMPRTLKAINVARDGGLVSIEQKPPTNLDYRAADPGKGIEIPIDRLVAYSWEREGAAWAGSSLLEPAYKNWLVKDLLLKFEAGAIERNSMGIPVLTNAQGATQEQINTGQDLVEKYRAGSRGGASLPYGAILKLLGVSGQLLNPRPAIEYHDAQIGRVALAHFLNLDGQGGSYALASTQADLFTTSLNTAAQFIADTATQHIVADLVDWNWGPAEPIPLITFDDLRSGSLEIANALRTLADAGLIRPDRSIEEWLRRDLGAPAKDTPSPQQPWAPDQSPDAAPGIEGGDNNA